MHNKSITWVLLIVALATSSGCGTPPSTAPLDANANTNSMQQAIISGQRTGPEAFSAVGALVSTDRYGRTLHLCTATLIAPDVVLTAAHCVRPRNRPPAGWQMWFSTADDASQFARTKPIRIAHTLLHDDYDPDAPLEVPLAWRAATTPVERAAVAELEAACGTTENAALDLAFWQCVATLSPELQQRLGLVDGAVNMRDVALAILAEPVQNAALALLPTAVTAPVWPTQRMQAVGYGVYERSTPNGARGLRHVGEVQLDAVGLYELQVGFTQSQLAFGDSGGPLFVAGDVALEIMGIASRSLVDDEGHCRGPTLYAKAQAFTPWIRQSLREACQQKVRDWQMCKAHPF